MSNEKDTHENASDVDAVNPGSTPKDEDVLSDNELDTVAGGLNPQPLPPRARTGVLPNEGWER